MESCPCLLALVLEVQNELVNDVQSLKFFRRSKEIKDLDYFQLWWPAFLFVFFIFVLANG